jgi:hypothetical protein
MQWEKEPVGDVRFRQNGGRPCAKHEVVVVVVWIHLYETRRLARSGIGYYSTQAIAG